MMKKDKTLLYVVRYPIYEGFHLKQKFDGQLNAFRQLGFHTLYIGFDKERFYLIDGDEKIVLGKTRFGIPNYFHTFAYIDLYKAAMKVVQNYSVDVVYYRMAPAFKKTYTMAKCFQKYHCKYILEIPTYTSDVKETELSFARKVFGSYSGIWEKKMETLPSLYVFMGDGNFSTFHGVPAIRIENGIDPDLMPVRTPVNETDTVHILALSSMNYWHGYDRLINSLAQYRGNNNVVIHMVGSNDGGCLEEWKELSHQTNLDEKVFFHGPLFGKELDQVFDLCDIGVNSIGKYRKGSNDSSELKTREYISRGLPFVTSVYDVALDGLDTDLYYQITNDEKIPSMDGIVEFALKVKDDPTAKDRLHDHAVRTMTWKSQYQKVFEKLEEGKMI
jgi:glycosyltransferase involved in cell wall biosynthesis